VIDRSRYDPRGIQLRPGFAQLAERGADIERHVMQPDCRLAAAAALAGDFHHREVVMIAERKERHLETTVVEPGAHRQAEHAVVETFGPLAVRHPQHDMPQRLDLHVSSFVDMPGHCSPATDRADCAAKQDSTTRD